MNALWKGAAALATVLLFACAGRALDVKDPKKPAPLDPQGEPNYAKEGEPHYLLWYDQRGWHLRTLTPKNKHRFKGTIEIKNGTIDTIHSFKLEAKGKLADHWQLDKKRDKLTFDFETAEDSDGIDFRLNDEAKEVRFQLLIDGKEKKEQVFVGKQSHHPKDLPFQLPAHPGKK